MTGQSQCIVTTKRDRTAYLTVPEKGFIKQRWESERRHCRKHCKISLLLEENNDLMWIGWNWQMRGSNTAKVQKCSGKSDEFLLDDMLLWVWREKVYSMFTGRIMRTWSMPRNLGSTYLTPLQILLDLWMTNTWIRRGRELKLKGLHLFCSLHILPGWWEVQLHQRVKVMMMHF